MEIELEVNREFIEKDMARKLGDIHEQVVMAIRRPGGRFLLITKPFYSEGIYRMPSGQMHEGETPEEALRREAFEETGLAVELDCELETVNWTFKAGDLRLKYVSHLMLTKETSGIPACRDAAEQITDYREVAPCDLGKTTQLLEGLTGRWRDWGQFRALDHRLIHDKLSP